MTGWHTLKHCCYGDEFVALTGGWRSLSWGGGYRKQDLEKFCEQVRTAVALQPYVVERTSAAWGCSTFVTRLVSSN